MLIEIGDKEYDVKVVKSEEDKIKGLQGIKSLPKDEGMLFIYDEPQTVRMWMKDTYIPLDIIFINEEKEVISIYKGEPLNEDMAEEDNVSYVLEVNQNSGIKEGDELEIIDDEDDDNVMQIIGTDGKVVMEIVGGERIFSRKNTKTLIRMAKKADMTKSDSDYKRLGNKMFSYIREQDNRDPEYVEIKD